MNSSHVVVAPEVAAAVDEGQAVVALESTVISHGLPYPHNLELALELESIVRRHGAVPATIAILHGVVKAGLTADEIQRLARGETPTLKISRRDFGMAIAEKADGATTVAGTMIVAHKAGIKVFATGGIGGVHRGESGDVSADLPELSQTPVAVVCAGAKAILDLPRTLEWLETAGVPVLGYQTDEFPAFYTRSSELKLTQWVDSAQAAAAVIAAQWGFGLGSGVLVTVPIPLEAALDASEVEGYIHQALGAAAAQKITGKDITPFLLATLGEISGGKSLNANLALLRNNAAIAAQIAVRLAEIEVR